MVDQIVSILSAMSIVLVEDSARPAFRSFVTARLSKRKYSLGWLPKSDEENGTGDEAIIRRNVLWAMGELAEDDATLREAETYASRWLSDPTAVDADTAAVAVDLASRHAGPGRLADLSLAAKSGKTREDRITALRAFGGFDDAPVLRSALDTSLGPDVGPHEMRYVLMSALGRRRGRDVVDAWVRERWDDLRKKLPGSLSAGLVRMAGVACTKGEIEERRAFYTTRAADIEGAERPLAEALENATLCAELRSHAASSLTRDLRNRAARP